MNTAFRSLILLEVAVSFLAAEVDTQTKFETLGPSGCGTGQAKCHNSEVRNMIDKHKYSKINLLDGENSETYAIKYGLKMEDAFKGTSKCMECHGTIISGRENEEIDEGVSCESCHGPGSGYKERHQKDQGGYDEAVKFGMVGLKQPNARAKACVRCHYIADSEILRTGHPSGKRFNYKTGMRSVAKHWSRSGRQLSEEDQDLKYFKTAMNAKGPVVELPPSKTTNLKSAKEQVVQKQLVQIVQVPGVKKPDRIDPSLIPLPLETTGDMPVDQLLLLLKRRLEELYRITGG